MHKLVGYIGGWHAVQVQEAHEHLYLPLATDDSPDPPVLPTKPALHAVIHNAQAQCSLHKNLEQSAQAPQRTWKQAYMKKPPSLAW